LQENEFALGDFTLPRFEQVLAATLSPSNDNFYQGINSGGTGKDQGKQEIGCCGDRWRSKDPLTGLL